MARRNGRTNTVRQLREALGLGVQAFADEIGVSRQRVWQMERAGASGKLACEIADRYRETLHRLGLTAEDLIRGKRAA